MHGISPGRRLHCRANLTLRTKQYTARPVIRRTSTICRILALTVEDTYYMIHLKIKILSGIDACTLDSMRTTLELSCWIAIVSFGVECGAHLWGSDQSRTQRQHRQRQRQGSCGSWGTFLRSPPWRHRLQIPSWKRASWESSSYSHASCFSPKSELIYIIQKKNGKIFLTTNLRGYSILDRVMRNTPFFSEDMPSCPQKL